MAKRSEATASTESHEALQRDVAASLLSSSGNKTAGLVALWYRAHPHSYRIGFVVRAGRRVHVMCSLRNQIGMVCKELAMLHQSWTQRCEREDPAWKSLKQQSRGWRNIQPGDMLQPVEDMSFQRLYTCDRCSKIVRMQWNTSPSERWRCLCPGISRQGNGLEVEVVCEGSIGFCKRATANFGAGLRSVSSADSHLLQTTCSNKCGRQVVGLPIVGQECDACKGFMIATKYMSAAKK